MILNKVRKTIKKHRLFDQGDRVLVAVSGGPDSVCLLDVLVKLSREWELTLAVAHFNHKLREEADKEEQFVSRLAGKYGLSFFSGASNVKEIAEKRGLGLEEAARHERYKFLEEVSSREGFSKIALGHTLSDNVETFFMRAVRGASLEGLKGILPKKDHIVRPLIEVTREEIFSYLKKEELLWVEDSSNKDTSFLRNWVRHRLLTLIKERNPSIEETLGATLQGLLWDWLFIEEEVDRALDKMDYRFENGTLYINLSNFDFHEAIKRHALSKLIYRFFLPWKIRGFNSSPY